MYTNAELFITAARQSVEQKPLFLSNVTLSVPDDADGCLDLDAEKERLSHVWDIAHLSVKQMVQDVGISMAAFAKQTGIPYRTLQNWCLGERECPVYIRFLLAEHYGLI